MEKGQSWSFPRARRRGRAWTNLERKSVQARALIQQSPYLLPIMLDDTQLPGVPATAGYLDARGMTAQTIAETIVNKVRSAMARLGTSNP